MSNTNEVIQLLKVEGMWHKNQQSVINQALALLESEPEPGELIFQCPNCKRFYQKEIICPYCKSDVARSAKSNDIIDRLTAENKAKDLTIELIKNHAALNYDNTMLGLIAEIEKDPEGFEKFLKG